MFFFVMLNVSEASYISLHKKILHFIQNRACEFACLP